VLLTFIHFPGKETEKAIRCRSHSVDGSPLADSIAPSRGWLRKDFSDETEDNSDPDDTVISTPTPRSDASTVCPSTSTHSPPSGPPVRTLFPTACHSQTIPCLGSSLASQCAANFPSSCIDKSGSFSAAQLVAASYIGNQVIVPSSCIDKSGSFSAAQLVAASYIGNQHLGGESFTLDVPRRTTEKWSWTMSDDAQVGVLAVKDFKGEVAQVFNKTFNKSDKRKRWFVNGDNKGFVVAVGISRKEMIKAAGFVEKYFAVKHVAGGEAEEEEEEEAELGAMPTRRKDFR